MENHKLIALALEKARRGFLDEAERMLALEATARPHGLLFGHWADLLSQLGRHSEAVLVCRRALDLNEGDGLASVVMGEILMRLSQHEEAMEWLERAKQASVHSARHRPYVNLAKIYLSQSLFSEALGELEMAHFFEPQDLEIRLSVERLREREKAVPAGRTLNLFGGGGVGKASATRHRDGEGQAASPRDSSKNSARDGRPDDEPRVALSVRALLNKDR